MLAGDDEEQGYPTKDRQDRADAGHEVCASAETAQERARSDEAENTAGQIVSVAESSPDP